MYFYQCTHEPALLCLSIEIRKKSLYSVHGDEEKTNALYKMFKKSKRFF